MSRTTIKARTLVVAWMAAALVAGGATAASAATHSPVPSPAGASATRAAVQKEVARIEAQQGRSAPAAAPPSVWSTDNSSNTWNGGCSASAHADYYPANDQAQMRTTVTSPYLFAACRVNAQLWIDTASGSFPGATNYAMACAVLDPTCASTQTTNGNYYGATPGLTGFVASVNDALQAIGLPPTYTRAQAVRGVHLTFANAG